MHEWALNIGGSKGQVECELLGEKPVSVTLYSLPYTGQGHNADIRVGQCYNADIRVGQGYNADIRVGQGYNADIRVGQVYNSDIRVG